LIRTPNDSREIILRPLRSPSHLLVRSRFHSDSDHSYKGQGRTILQPGTQSTITSNLKHRPLTLARNNTPSYITVACSSRSTRNKEIASKTRTHQAHLDRHQSRHLRLTKQTSPRAYHIEISSLDLILVNYETVLRTYKPSANSSTSLNHPSWNNTIPVFPKLIDWSVPYINSVHGHHSHHLDLEQHVRRQHRCGYPYGWK